MIFIFSARVTDTWSPSDRWSLSPVPPHCVLLIRPRAVWPHPSRAATRACGANWTTAAARGRATPSRGGIVLSNIRGGRCAAVRWIGVCERSRFYSFCLERMNWLRAGRRGGKRRCDEMLSSGKWLLPSLVRRSHLRGLHLVSGEI